MFKALKHKGILVSFHKLILSVVSLVAPEGFLAVVLCGYLSPTLGWLVASYPVPALRTINGLHPVWAQDSSPCHRRKWLEMITSLFCIAFVQFPEGTSFSATCGTMCTNFFFFLKEIQVMEGLSLLLSKCRGNSVKRTEVSENASRRFY